MVNNPFVSYLNRYTTVSPEHEAAFDEFIAQTKPPIGNPLQLETKVEKFLLAHFQKENPTSVILTGNAGDGKTYLCRKVASGISESSFSGWDKNPIKEVQLPQRKLRIIKDLSEMSEADGKEVIKSLIEEQDNNISFLIAANEGRLRAVLQNEGFSQFNKNIDEQLREGPQTGNKEVIVINLNKVTTSSFVNQAISWFASEGNWISCISCPANNKCPITFNAKRLGQENIKKQITFLYQILEHMNFHITIRDMLIHLAYTLTGGLNCECIIQNHNSIKWQPQDHVYFENIWGEKASELERRRISVINHLRPLNVGKWSHFELDDFIINSEADDSELHKEHQVLFPPALDLGFTLFEQQRKNYLRGGAASPDPNEKHPLLNWLPRIRRKLFFEWKNAKTENLFPFIGLSSYFTLLEGDQGLLDSFRSELILGLNRAFTGLYLTTTDVLYVTTQYAHSSEPSLPIVRVQIPSMYIKLKVIFNENEAINWDSPVLQLIIPQLPNSKTEEDLVWTIDLVQFEYLIRRSRGGTPDILSNECDLSIRRYKDQLLASFSNEQEDARQIHFFAKRDNKYKLMKLSVDETDKFRI